MPQWTHKFQGACGLEMLGRKNQTEIQETRTETQNRGEQPSEY